VDNPPPSTIKDYPRNEAGVMDSITDHLSDVGSSLNTWAPPRDQARCAAEKLVQRIGVSRLFQLGFDPVVGSLSLSYDDAERTAAINILVGCIDFTTGLTELAASYNKLGVKPSACTAESIDRQGLTRDLVLGLLNGTPTDPLAQNARLGVGMAKALAECLGTEDLLPMVPSDPFPDDEQNATTTTALGASANPAGTTTTTTPAGTTTTR
jgi:hypothetical protein